MVRPIVIRTIVLPASSLSSGSIGANSQDTQAPTADQQETARKIRIDVNGTAIITTLDDNATSRDFVALLPLTVTLEDYASTEKISYLPNFWNRDS